MHLGTETVPCPTSISKANAQHLAMGLWEHHFPLALKSGTEKLTFWEGKGECAQQREGISYPEEIGEPWQRSGLVNRTFKIGYQSCNFLRRRNRTSIVACAGIC